MGLELEVLGNGTYELCIKMAADGRLVFRDQDRLQFLSFFFGDGVPRVTRGTGYPGGLMKAGKGMGSPKKYPSSSSSEEEEEDEEVNDG